MKQKKNAQFGTRSLCYPQILTFVKIKGLKDPFIAFQQSFIVVTHFRNIKFSNWSWKNWSFTAENPHLRFSRISFFESLVPKRFTGLYVWLVQNMSIIKISSQKLTKKKSKNDDKAFIHGHNKGGLIFLEAFWLQDEKIEFHETLLINSLCKKNFWISWQIKKLASKILCSVDHVKIRPFSFSLFPQIDGFLPIPSNFVVKFRFLSSKNHFQVLFGYKLGRVRGIKVWILIHVFEWNF